MGRFLDGGLRGFSLLLAASLLVAPARGSGENNPYTRAVALISQLREDLGREELSDGRRRRLTQLQEAALAYQASTQEACLGRLALFQASREEDPAATEALAETLEGWGEQEARIEIAVLAESRALLAADLRGLQAKKPVQVREGRQLEGLAGDPSLPEVLRAAATEVLGAYREEVAAHEQEVQLLEQELSLLEGYLLRVRARLRSLVR